MTPNPHPQPVQKSWIRRHGKLTIALVVSGVAALVAVIAIAAASDTSDKELGAQDVCHQFVDDGIPGKTGNEFRDEHTEHVEGDQWRVTGTVRTTSYGELFNTTRHGKYVCLVTNTAEHGWKLNNLTFTGDLADLNE